MSFEVGNIFATADSDPANSLLRSPVMIITGICLWGVNLNILKRYDLLTRIAPLLNLNPGNASNKAAAPPDTDTDTDADSSLITITKSTSTSVHVDTNRKRVTSTISNNHDADTNIAPPPTPRPPSKISTRSQTLIKFALALIFFLYASQHLYISFLGGSPIVAVVLFHAFSLLTLLLHPNESIVWLREAIISFLMRVGTIIMNLLETNKSVSFIDVFISDALCSLSKVFFDWGLMCVFCYHYPLGAPRNWTTIMLPSLCASLPYFIRGRQCLVGYNLEKEKGRGGILSLLNFYKYMSSFLPIMLSAIQQIYNPDADAHIDAEMLENLLLFFLFVNSVYCCVWDVLMDWGMCRCGGSGGNGNNNNNNNNNNSERKLHFGSTLSYLAIFLNVCLRFSWLLRFNDAVFNDKNKYIFLLEMGEVVRRAGWNLLRLEWELINTPACVVVEQQELELKDEKELESKSPKQRRRSFDGIEMI
ncbi:hypothetical protein ScalyP_jg8061 [Parmales sp. scaly parma]|nr:hypothetical protein ScalyP_jg8061 [Parmales sp. scaly parma]